MAKKNYAQNLLKEVKELRTARGQAKQAKIADIFNDGTRPLSYQNYYAKERSRTKKEAKSALGQLAGAALQGRRYTKSGKQITEQTIAKKAAKKVSAKQDKAASARKGTKPKTSKKK